MQKGYGKLRVRHTHSTALATHISLMLHARPRPSSAAIACHHCDMPLCVNPEHLYWGTHAMNTSDGVRRGHITGRELDAYYVRRRARTHCHQGHEYTPENTAIHKDGYRVCRACHRMQQLAYTGRQI
ncbi:MAG TPA: hypothetical protein VGI78_00525 [Acetobacteraceae bacterium]